MKIINLIIYNQQMIKYLIKNKLKEIGNLLNQVLKVNTVYHRKDLIKVKKNLEQNIRIGKKVLNLDRKINKN